KKLLTFWRQPPPPGGMGPAFGLAPAFGVAPALGLPPPPLGGTLPPTPWVTGGGSGTVLLVVAPGAAPSRSGGSKPSALAYEKGSLLALPLVVDGRAPALAVDDCHTSSGVP